jgi:hypothetical protein
MSRPSPMSTPASGHLARLPLPAPLLALLLLALLLGGCVQDEAVVSVGPVSFTESELLGLGEAQRYHLGLLAAVGLAVASGDEAVMGGPVLEYRRAGRLAERLREEVILEAAGVTEEELEARYLTDPDHELVVRHLVVLSERWRPEEERSRARGRAAAALARVEGGEPFEAVVGEISEEPGAARREGLLQPGREGTWVREFWEAASALEEGERSPVVETEYGFHVLRLEERRLLPFEEARDRVVGEVARLLGGGAAWEAWLEERRAGVVLDPDAIAAFDPADPTEGVALASWPGGALDTALAGRRLRGLPAREYEAFLQGESGTREERIRELAHLTLQEREAQARSLRLRPTTEGELQREWERAVTEWSVFLGFRRDMRPEGVGETALAGLRATGQNARIAREEIRSWAPAIEAWIPIVLDPGA